MDKILLVDLDGVVIKSKQGYFSNRFSAEYKVPIEDVLTFFKEEYQQTAIGKSDLRAVLPDYLHKWGWQGTVDDFLSYWFEGDVVINKQVVSLIQNLRKQNIKCYLASDNARERAEYLQKEFKFDDLFDGGFYSCQLGVTKSNPLFFSNIQNQLGVNADQLIFWDDDSKNVEVASHSGLQAFVYDDFGDFVRQLDVLIPDEMSKVMAFDTTDFYCDLVFSGELKIDKVKETEGLLAFRHTRPSYEHHIVIVPKKHVSNLLEVEDMGIIAEVFTIARDIILDQGWDQTNFRIITNGGSFQDSKHLHFHLVSGNKR